MKQTADAVLPAVAERARLAEVASFRFLRASAEPVFDEIVRIAARIFNVPTCLLSLVDEDIQWFAARTGYDPCETSRGVSFCAYALGSDRVLVVPDARRDMRFCNNPLVTGEPHIRFYAGAPLVTSEGNILGTLCVIDQKPRDGFSAEDAEMLRSMAKMAVDQLELKRLSEMQRAALCVNQTSPDAIIHMSSEGLITYANDGAFRISGYVKEELINQPISKILPAKLRRKMAAAVRKFTHSKAEFLSFKPVEGVALTKANGEIPVEFSAAIWGSHDGFSMGLIVRDITERKRREASFEMLFDRNPIPMWICDSETLDFVAINDAACALYGLTRPQALAKNAMDLHLEEEREEIRAAIASFGEFYQSETPGTQLTVTGKPLRILIFARRLHHHGKDCVVVANINVTEREKAESDLASTQIFLNAVIESIPSMVFVKEARDGRFVLLNKAGEKLLGTTRDKLIGKSDFDLFEHADAERFREKDQQVVASGGLVTIENEPLTTPNGIRTLRTQKVSVPDVEGNTRYLLGISEDVTEKLRIEERNRHLSLHDILTDLPNRLSFQTAIQHKLSRPEPFALMMIDLDRFKAVNDTLGHAAGDDLLRQVSQRLNSVKSQDDMLSRLGGDEFGLVHPFGPDGQDGAIRLAERLVAMLCEPFLVEGQLTTIGCSVGIAMRPDHGAHADVLMKRADLALYAAKATSDGGVLVFEPAMEDRTERERLLREELKHALAHRQLDVHYQPIIDASSGDVVCCEALLRWTHPKLGTISPTEFIPAAEATGLIVSIGQFVLETACRDATSWPRNINVAVNLSPRQFSGFGLPAAVARALQSSGLAPERLELEITESVFLSDTQDNMNILSDLKNLGVRIALDDFGTGYSSLSYLRKFSFDKLKIDQSFITEVAHSGESLAIVRAVIGLGRSFSAVVTAEGVEDIDQYERLRAEGCDQVQGYLISKPVPLEGLSFVLAQKVQAAIR
jgi:diguanylate cyclase (GGDEF)-like protein/PAS domain S-box-containing protein